MNNRSENVKVWYKYIRGDTNEPTHVGIFADHVQYDDIIMVEKHDLADILDAEGYLDYWLETYYADVVKKLKSGQYKIDPKIRKKSRN